MNAIAGSKAEFSYLKVSRDCPEGNFWKKKKEKKGQSTIIATMDV